MQSLPHLACNCHQQRPKGKGVTAACDQTTVCRKENAVVACSALKKKYRDILAGSDRGEEHAEEIAFVSDNQLATAFSMSG